jgi:uncharacterized delta-60 repeat protein
MSTKLAACVVVGVASACVAGAAVGANGSGRLDPSFGEGGRVVVNGIRECVPGEGGCWAGIGMAIQRNGMIVTAGGTLDSDCGSRFSVARLRKSGRLDAAFGDGGRVLTAFDGSAVAHAVAVLPDNRIVVGGEFLGTPSRPCPDHLHLGDGKGFALARYRPDGTLDPSFGQDGMVVTPFDEGAGLDVLLQPDGKVVVVGASSGGLALARYSVHGSLDPSFGRNGIVDARFRSAEIPGRAALDNAGRILVPVAGGCDTCSAYVLRYDGHGRLDATFGRRGRAGVALSLIGAAATFHGQIVIAGMTNRIAVLRLSSAGKLDRRFGRNGKLLLPVTSGLEPVLAIQKTGAILVAAGGRPRGAKGFNDYNFTLTRILPNGRLDRRFGRRGVVTDDLGGRDFGQAVAVRPDGKILVAGVVGRVANGIGLVRHLP